MLNEMIIATTNAKKSKTITDSKGLSMIFVGSKGKWWRYRYTLDGRRNTISLGTWPDVSLEKARALRDDYNEMLSNGVDPSWYKKRKQKKLHRSISFEKVIRHWHKQHTQNCTQLYSRHLLAQLDRYIFPFLGKLPIRLVDEELLLDGIRAIENLGYTSTAHRVRSTCERVFRYAMVYGYCERNVAANIKDALVPNTVTHFKTLTNPGDIAQLMRDIYNYDGSDVVRHALLLQALTFVRPCEIAKARYQDVDFKLKQWRIPANMMKSRREHIVPLSSQALEVFKYMYENHHTDDNVYVFRNHRENGKYGHMQTQSINNGLKVMGYKDKMVAHGFRAMASTQLNEHGFRADLIEKQLAHAPANQTRASYNHAEYLPERSEMMQWWADHLGKLRQKC
jgi:integrase